jgi:enoyl-CoA hydratase/carnithine racemase
VADREPIRLFADGTLCLRRTGELATLEIRRPEQRNAVSLAMWNVLPEAVSEAALDPSLRALILRGSGTEAFSAGADLDELPEIYSDAVATRTYLAAMHRAYAALRGLPFPTIAAIRGSCMGGGCGLALACDLRFASSDARLAIPAAKLGLAYSFADTALLVEHVGPARAKDLLCSGRLVDAAEALNIGLIDFIAEVDAFDRVVADYAQALCRRSPASVRFAKATVNAIACGARGETGEMREALETLLRGPDFQEGYRAFKEKRVPRFDDPPPAFMPRKDADHERN